MVVFLRKYRKIFWLRCILGTVGKTLTEVPENKKFFIWGARREKKIFFGSECHTFCFGLYFGKPGSVGRVIIVLWILTIRDAPAGGLFIFLGRVKGYPCGDTGVLYVILIGTVGMLGVGENLSRRR